MLWLSIRPKYVEAILSGSKRVELRRKCPRVEHGQALIYATAPQMELVGSFEIASVTRAPLNLLWRSVKNIAGVSRSEFDAYFEGLEFGVSIKIGRLVKLKRPIPLSDLRRIWPAFQPPQGFRYLAGAETDALGMTPLGRVA